MSDQFRPLSHAQLRLWLLDRLEPGSAAYNIGRMFRLRGTLSEAALRHSLHAVVARHEILRTTFVEMDGEPMQVVAATREVEMAVVDLSSAPEREREAEALRQARTEAQRPFDLTGDALLGATLLRLGKDDHLLWLVMHHIVTDAWSMSLLFDELGQHYEASVTGRPVAVPVLRYLYWLAGMRASLPQEYLVNIPYVLAFPLLGPIEWYVWAAIVTRYHHIHHSADPQHYVANLGDLLTIWDRLFGTYVDPGTVRKELSFGIDSEDPTARLVLGV